MRNKTAKKLLLTAAVLLASVFGAVNVQALSKQDVDINDCINGENIAWTSCPIIDSIRNSVEGLYSWLIENWLAVNPKLLAFANPDDPGSSVFAAWRYFQGLANILLIIYLLIVILSQVTGMGISNYGVKKALPRIVLAAVLINLSYFICQAAVDLANILGNGIFGLLDGLITSSGIVADGQNDFGYSIALLGILALVVTAVVVMVVMNPAFINFAMMGLISALVAVVFLFIVLGLRQVLTVLLVAISPLAILCSTFPGLRSLYKKWLNLFKGLLMAYPICSVLIGGGALAAQVLYQAWGGDSNFFAAVACMIICVVPFFFIPSVTMKSIGALDSVIDKVRYGKNGEGGVSGFAKHGYKNSGGYKNSDMSRRLERSAEKKRLYRRAGIKTDIRGNAKRDANGDIIRRRARNGRLKGDTHYLGAAMSQVEQEDRLNRYINNPNMISDREDKDMVSEYEHAFRNDAADPDKLIGTVGTGGAKSTGMTAAIEDFQKAICDGNKMEERKAKAKIAAYGRLLASTRDGQKKMSQQLMSINSSTMANRDKVVESMFSGLGAGDMQRLAVEAPRLGGYASAVNSGSYVDYSSFGYTSEMLGNLSQEDFGALDNDYKREIFSQAALSGSMFDNDGNLKSSFRVLDNEFATNLARLTGTTAGNPDAMAKMSLGAQQWTNAFNAQRQAQIQAMSAGFQSGSITEASLKSQYLTAASGGQGMKMEAIEMELRRRNIPNLESEIEGLRRAAEATNNPNAKASAANSRTQN